MKKLLTILAILLCNVCYSQIADGTYHFSTITISSGQIVSIDSAVEIDPTVNSDIKTINNSRMNQWDQGYLAYTWGNPSGNYMALGGSYNNPNCINSLYFNKIVSWPGATTDYVRGDGSVTSLPVAKRQESYSGTTNSSGLYTVTYSIAYSVTPNVQFQINGGSNKQTILLTSSSTTGFTVYVQVRTDIVGLLPSYSNVNGQAVDILVTAK